jgi:hypothetical protein
MIANSIHVWSSSPRTNVLGHSQSSPSGLIAVDNPSQDYPGFPVRCSGHVCVCGFLYGKPHEAQCLQQATQEIRVRPGLFSAVPTGLIAICPVVDLFLTTAIRISRSEKLIWTRRCWIWLPSLESKYRAPLDLLFQPTAKRPIRHRVGMPWLGPRDALFVAWHSQLAWSF